MKNIVKFDGAILSMTAKDMRRFAAHVQKTATCWIWRGTKQIGGYGRFFAQKHNLGAHRVLLILRLGKASNLYACHRCSNTSCVRPHPSHVYLGTSQENVADLLASGRHIVQNMIGSLRSTAKINENVAKEMYKQYWQERQSIPEIGKMHGVSRYLVKSVVMGKTWMHATKGNRVTHLERRPKKIPKGETHSAAKVTEKIVKAMREKHADGHRICDLAKTYGVSSGCVKHIVNRTNWRHVK